jgi:hypothetical protein
MEESLPEMSLPLSQGFDSECTSLVGVTFSMHLLLSSKSEHVALNNIISFLLFVPLFAKALSLYTWFYIGASGQRGWGNRAHIWWETTEENILEKNCIGHNGLPLS